MNKRHIATCSRVELARKKMASDEQCKKLSTHIIVDVGGALVFVCDEHFYEACAELQKLNGKFTWTLLVWSDENGHAVEE